MLLSQRIAFVTGPAKGMGEAVSLSLADEGADLALVGRDLAPIEEVAGKVRERGRRAVVIGCDVTDPADVDAAAAQAAEALGPVDILVNVAGGRGPIGKSGVETTPEEFDDIMRLNVTGCFLTMRALLPGMMERRYGKIVNIGGTFGLRGRAGRLSYSASKWGMRGLTKSFALEAGPFNVNVNSVCPGMVEGPRFEKVCAEMAERLGVSLDEAKANHAADYALKRVSTAQDVADAVVFLASEKSRQITGQDLAVDGGWVI
ncbi:SDR family NAD(P)-dependent oxidoreductase [Acuticoccus sediminis]|uniref:SDR family NAD(P)-dependent oxidoreductase n=1 Tax=Acuticoccus sediminis TaxID=2184697 RepID=UPI001CFF24E2|nr:SDR family oxidoreductase [Acuticoccus sediminis]